MAVQRLRGYVALHQLVAKLGFISTNAALPPWRWRRAARASFEATIGSLALLAAFGTRLSEGLVGTVACASVMGDLGLARVLMEKGSGILTEMGSPHAGFEGAMPALVGAWVGAWPVHLDWQAEWQAWPLPVITGAIIGHIAMHLALCLSVNCGFDLRRLPITRRLCGNA